MVCAIFGHHRVQGQLSETSRRLRPIFRPLPRLALALDARGTEHGQSAGQLPADRIERPRAALRAADDTRGIGRGLHDGYPACVSVMFTAEMVAT